MKSTTIIRSLLLLAVLAVVAYFVVLNVADYFRYRYIMNLDKHLTAADFKQIADSVASSGTNEISMPAAILDKLGATTSFLDRNTHNGDISASAILYERGEREIVGVYPNYTVAKLYVDITKQNQKIMLGENFTGKPVFRTLWVANPSLGEQTTPTRRLTLYEGKEPIQTDWWVIWSRL